MAAMFGGFSEARTFASRLNRASLSAFCENSTGKTLMATSRSSFPSRAQIYFVHPAFPDRLEDLVMSKLPTNFERHERDNLGTNGA